MQKSIKDILNVKFVKAVLSEADDDITQFKNKITDPKQSNAAYKLADDLILAEDEHRSALDIWNEFNAALPADMKAAMKGKLTSVPTPASTAPEPPPVPASRARTPG